MSRARVALSWLPVGLLGFTVSAAGAVDAPVILVRAGDSFRPGWRYTWARW